MDVLLLYGGKSCEHDVSVVTAKQVLPNLCGNVVEVYVTREGEWKLVKNMPRPQDFADEKKIKKLTAVTLLAGDKNLYIKSKNKLKKLCQPSVAVLCFHGVNGEDGSVQGLLQLCGIAHTSCEVGASALAMDKILCKTFLKGMDAPVVDGIFVDKGKVDAYFFEMVSNRLGYPVIVKPSNLGSSIGISIANDGEGLAQALAVAFEFDNRVLVEKALQNCFDVNVSVFAHDDKIFASLLEKPTTWQEFLTFDDKYTSAKTGMASCKRQFPFECRFNKEICFWAKEIYKNMGCKGVVRIDFLVCDDGFFVNEVNTIPGSFAYYLWKDEFDFKTLVQKQIDEGVRVQRQKEKLTFLYKSAVLSNCRGKK